MTKELLSESESWPENEYEKIMVIFDNQLVGQQIMIGNKMHIKVKNHTCLGQTISVKLVHKI